VFAGAGLLFRPLILWVIF